MILISEKSSDRSLDISTEVVAESVSMEPAGESFGWLVASCNPSRLSRAAEVTYETLRKFDEYANLSKDEVVVLAQKKELEFENVNQDLLSSSYFYIRMPVEKTVDNQLTFKGSIVNHLKKYSSNLHLMYDNVISNDEIRKITSSELSSKRVQVSGKPGSFKDNFVIITQGPLKNFNGKLSSSSNNHSVVLFKIFGRNDVKLHINNTYFSCERKV